MPLITQRLGRRELQKLKTRALRRRVWLRVVSRLERGLVNAVIQTLDVVKSTLLTKVLSRIMRKLALAMESKVARAIREVGCSLAQKASLVALSWGNENAESWRHDPQFARFLAVIAINDPSFFRTQ
jgi:hypothetical protein